MGIIGAAVIYYHVNMIGGTDVYATMESADRFNHLPQITFGYHSYHS